MHWMLLPLRRYADFQGRSCRLEYWMFTLFVVLVTLSIFLVAAFTGSRMNFDFETETPPPLDMALIGMLLLFYAAILIPSIAVTVRRFHDRGMSGWSYLLTLIPWVGGLILFVFMVLPGDTGENQYGADPKDAVAAVFN